MRNKNIVNILALIVLAIYVISPVDAIPGPVDDTILCLLYAYLNYRNSNSGVPGNRKISENEPGTPSSSLFDYLRRVKASEPFPVRKLFVQCH